MCLHNYIGNLHVATCSPLETTSTDQLKALFFFISLSKWFLITLFNLITLWKSMEYRTHHHHYSDLAPNIQHIFYFAHAFPIWFCAQLGNRVAKYWNIQFFFETTECSIGKKICVEKFEFEKCEYNEKWA